MALFAVGLMYLLGLGAAPFLDPPEGFHAAIARTMLSTGDWLTPHVEGVPYFDDPPVLYWIMAAGFAVGGVSEWTARLWPALTAIGLTAATAWLGVLLANARVGLLAALMVAANLGIFVYGRLVEPDLPFILCITLAYAGFAVTYNGGGRRGLALFYAALGLAALSKDVLGALGPLAAVAAFLWLTRERPLGMWAPWWGVGLLLLVAVPWYVAVETANPGFLWYTVVDDHLLSFTRQRVFPDEDVPLGAVQFLGVSLAAFLPWSLALPWAAARALRRPWRGPRERLWLLFAIWPLLVIGFFTLSPFKLSQHALPAFPALALLVARVWDETIEAEPGAPAPRALLVPLLVLFAVAAAASGLAIAGRLPVPDGPLASVDVATPGLAARAPAAAGLPPAAYVPVLVKCTVVFGLATIGLALAAWRRWPAAGVGVALAAMIAFLPVAGEGMAQFARGRSLRPLAEALVRRLGADDVIVHEGPLENSGSLLLAVRRPVHVVHGVRSNLAFGATFPEARDVFWDAARLQEAWTRPRRCFLLSTVDPERSVVRTLVPAHLVAHGGGRWLYTNLAD